MVRAFVALDHRLLEKALNEKYLGVFRIGAHDHGFGYLFGGIGGANDVETTIAQRASHVAGQSAFASGSKRGLAGDVGRALRDRGFNVIRTTNTAEKISKTVIVGADPKNPEVL